ncbi:MAG: toprim domain-containing protein [Thermoplasmata archaeon]
MSIRPLRYDATAGKPTTMRSGRGPSDALDEFVRLWERLRSESAEDGTVVLVEGGRDRTALRRLGLTGPIVTVHHGRPLAGTAHDLVGGSRRVIVLTDWDVEGGHLARRLREFLEADRISLDLEYRRRLARILRGELVHVEGLYGWARRLAERGGQTIDERLEPVARA